MTAPRSINSTRPFHSCAQDYIDKGWGVLPLPRRRKEYPPVGFTGRAGKFAEDDDLIRWLNDAQYTEGNIAIRVGNVLVIKGVRYEVIGIDVDNHSGKPGVRDLARLEKRYGRLPDTWISSSRDDGVSGIRFYLVPYGYGFKGKASDSIDIVQRVHRYAVVYPSWHPDTKTQYFWYEPGKRPEGQGFTLEIPSADQLPLLPDGWIDYLTRGGMRDDEGTYGIDLDSSMEEIHAWRKACFPKDIPDVPGGMCSLMRRVVDKHIRKIEESSSNHDKLLNFHWHIISLAAEGHSGYKAAIEEVEAVWKKDVTAKQKRLPQLANREITRSLIGAWRKIKAKADAFKDQGFHFFSTELCVPDGEFKVPQFFRDDKHWVDKVPLSSSTDEKPIDPRDYDKNDHGMALMFRDRVGDNVRYLSDYNGWAIYDGTTWHVESFAVAGTLFHRAVVKPCKKAGLAASVKFFQHLAAGGTKDDAIGRPLKAAMDKLNWIAEHYGNETKINAVLKRMGGLHDVAMKYSELNCRTDILGLPGGKVVQLMQPGKPRPKAKGYRIIDNAKEFLTTLETGCGLETDSRATELWSAYLERFLPDEHYRRDVQKVLGYILIGGNPDRKSIWLVGPSSTGKSTMIRCIEETLGGYGATFHPNAVLKEQSTNLNPELGNLLFKRGIFSSELGGQRISSEVFKQITGCDGISVTRKHANEQIYGTPHFTMVVATNNPPNIPDMDQATLRRIIVCPFETQVSSAEDDKRADVVLARDAKPAILNWLLEGYKLYIRRGIDIDSLHPKIQAATKDFANDTSDIAQFLNDLVEGAPEDVRYELFSDGIPTIESEKLHKDWGKITSNQLYSVYVDDCMKSNRKPMAPTAFGRKVGSLFGIKSKVDRMDGKPTRHYIGLRWRNEAAMSMRGN